MTTALGHIVAHGVGSLTSGLMGPFDRANKYLGNNNNPNEFPPVDLLAALWYSGLADVGDIFRGFAALGVDWRPYDAKQNLFSRLWTSAIEMRKPQLDLERWVEWWRQGRVGDDKLRGQLQRMGLDRQVYWPLIRDNYESLGAEAIRDAWLRGKIGEDDARQYYRSLGFTRQVDQNLLLNDTVVLTPGQLLVARNRDMMTDAQVDAYMKWHGFRDDVSRNAIQQLRFEIPGPSELTRMAVRHVFEPDLATQFGFDEEMPGDYLAWHAKQGYGQPFVITDPKSGNKHDMTWGKANWWSHWVWPSPTAAYEMVQRLRPTGGANNGPRSATGLKFTQKDLSSLLRGNDYPPHWRPFLQAISYRVLQRADIATGQTLGMIDNAEAIESYQDQGYTQADAVYLTNQVGGQVRWSQIQALRSRQMMRVIRAYQTGVIDKDNASVQVYKLSLPTLAETAQAEVLPFAQLLINANADTYVQAQIASVDASQAATLATEAMRAIKAAYMRFDIGDVQAGALLLQAGFVPIRAAEHVRIWKLILQRKGKNLTVAQVLRFYERGIINVAEASTRLSNAGYLAGDVQRLLADADVSLSLAAARSRKQAATSTAQAQKAQAAIVKAQQAATAKAQSQLAKHGTPAQLVKWLKRGLIPESEVDQRLTALGWPPQDIRRLVEDALSPGSKPITTKPQTPAPAP